MHSGSKLFQAIKQAVRRYCTAEGIDEGRFYYGGKPRENDEFPAIYHRSVLAEILREYYLFSYKMINELYNTNNNGSVPMLLLHAQDFSFTDKKNYKRIKESLSKLINEERRKINEL